VGHEIGGSLLALADRAQGVAGAELGGSPLFPGAHRGRFDQSVVGENCSNS